MFQPRSLATGTDYVPNHILRDALAPSLVRSGHCPEDSSLGYSGGRRPLIKRGFDPFGNGHGTNVTALTDQIDHRPVPLAHLDLLHLQTD